MKELTRLIRRVVVSVVLGAIITVGVSVGMAWLIPNPDQAVDRTGWSMSAWHDGTHACLTTMRWNRTSIDVGYAQIPMPETSVERIVSSVPLALSETDFRRAPWSVAWKTHISRKPVTGRLGAAQRSIWDIARGWPVPAMRYRYYYDYPVQGVTSGVPTIEVMSGLGIGLKSTTPARPIPAVLPYVPIMPGFALNTAAYAAAVFVLLTAARLLVVTVRLRRGRCPNCGYDLSGSGTSDGCPECGR